MSAALERLKQQNVQDERRQQLDTPETMEVLTSILAAVEAQNARIEAVAERQDKLTLFMKTMDDDLPERVASETSISQASASSSQQTASVESRLSEIESTLSEFATSLDGKRLQSASQSLIAETQKNHAATVSATEKLQVQAEENQKLVSRVGGAVQRIEQSADERIVKAIEQVAGEAGATVTAHLDSANDRAEALERVAARLASRLTWSAVGRLGIALLPLAAVLLVVGGLTMGAFHALGLGPLLGWAWESFAAAAVWWHKLLIALGTLTGTLAFGGAVWWGSLRVADTLRGW